MRLPGRLSGGLVVLASCLAASVPQPRSESGYQEDLVRAASDLLRADQRHAQADAAGTLADRLAAMFGDDVFMLAGGTIARGRDAAIAALGAVPENRESRVRWTPVRAGVSGDARHGFTFGYLTVIRRDSAVVPMKYLSYWRREPSGWKVVAYKRVGRGPGEVADTVWQPSLPPESTEYDPSPAREGALVRQLAAVELGFSTMAGRIGLGEAFRRHGASDAINLGGHASAGFVVGPDAIARLVSVGEPPGGSRLSWSADHVIVASSGDLGVTIGYIRVPHDDGVRRIPFSTIWRRDSVDQLWRFIAE